MAQGFVRIEGDEKVRQGVIAANTTTFAEGTPVFINTSGFLDVCTSSGEKVWGFCTEAKITTSDNQTVAMYKPRVIGCENVTFFADSDQAFTQTDAGAYVDIASSSAGVVTLNLAAGNTGQFFVVGLLSDIDPSADGDTDRIVVKVAEPQEFAFAQS